MLTLVALVLGGGAGCGTPDTPSALTHPLDPAVVGLLRPDTVRAVRIGAGVWYRYLWSPVGPWAVHVAEADLARCDLALRAMQADGREHGGGGREPVSSMVARASGGALAAVNADFFTPEGVPLGLEIVQGRMTHARERPGLVWRAGEPPWMGDVRISGDTVFAGRAYPRGREDGVTVAVGGRPELLDAGRRVGDLLVSSVPGFAASRHPRTAVAYDGRTARLWLVVVDGRQPPHSVGMTLPELAALLEALGATDALNLDGGGSSVMVVGARPWNRPADTGGERPVANALALVRDFSGCPR